jgi:hypothetical protein
MKLNNDWIIEENKYQCPYCKDIFTKKGICSHILRTHLNVKFGSGYNGHYNEKKFKDKISKIKKDHYNEKLGKIKEFEVFCFKCKKSFKIKEREYTFPKKEKYYCSAKCSHSHSFTEEQRKKCSEKTKKYYQNHPEKYSSNEKRRYGRLCKFNFNLKKYPDEFDFDLIRKYGLYSNNNLNGISRDHIISIDYGFKNNIDHNIINHPANCQLLKQNENASKHTNCGMTLDELEIKIFEWNKKYNQN